jgi:hypothetical protein
MASGISGIASRGDLREGAREVDGKDDADGPDQPEHLEPLVARPADQAEQGNQERERDREPAQQAADGDHRLQPVRCAAGHEGAGVGEVGVVEQVGSESPLDRQADPADRRRRT